MSKEPQQVKQNSTIVTFSEFLENVPPSINTEISELTDFPSRHYELLKPEIQLHCSNDTCNGIRFFRCTNNNNIYLYDDDYKFVYLSYICSNCRKTTKTFSLAAKRKINTNTGECYKLGESPVYGPPTPSRLIKLIGPDREIFLKGRRCENQGLGIGAFIYYRRVVEDQKNRILDEIIKVSTKLKVKDNIIDKLKEAKLETQFSKALSLAKDTVPEILLINGHNPLTLLHSALSNGVHNQTDEECLAIASSIRLVLSELSERLSQALKDEAELNSAVSKLMKIKK